ncbi:unnamed protein product, partial [Ixodes persulcatus]
DELLTKIKDGKASHVLTTPSEADLLKKLTEDSHIRERFVVGDKPGFISVTNFQKVPEESFIHLPEVDVEKELIALCFTSGTTGRPKAVEERHYSCVAGLQLYRLNMMFDETETVGALLAVAQTVGFRMIMRVVCSGAKCVIIPQETSFDEMVGIVRRHQITTLFADSTAIHQLATHMIQSGIRLPSVRDVVVIAVRITEKAAETIFSAFCLKSCRSMYGTTELSNVISWMPRDTMEHKTIGFPAPDVQMKVVDIDTGNVLGPKEHGELWVKSPTNMRAYYNNPDATAEVITPDGWLRTGDIVYYDETGRFYVVERIKQFFHCMGRQVPQSEIEAVLLSHESVEEAAVIDVPHPEYGDVAKAFVVLKPSYRGPRRTRTQELQQFVADRLAAHKHLYGGVVFVDSIPKNSLGKIDKRSLKRSA